MIVLSIILDKCDAWMLFLLILDTFFSFIYVPRITPATKLNDKKTIYKIFLKLSTL